MITDISGVVDGLANGASRLIIDKASLASQTAGRFISTWRAIGQPAQGAIPTTAALATLDTVGAMRFSNQVDPIKSYFAYGFVACSNATATVEIHDRLAHMGGLVLNSTASQTTNLPLNLQTLNLPAARRGNEDYGDIQWWLEVYADGGATASNATINVTYSDDTTGNLNTIAVGGTLRIGNLLGLDILRPTNKQDVNIKGINSVILSASTTVAGNFGFTATRPRAAMPTLVANKAEAYDWAFLGMPEIANDSCLTLLVLPTTTSSGTLRGGGKVIHG